MTKVKQLSTQNVNREKLHEFCGAMYALDILTGKWKLYILYKLEHSDLRFKELKELIPGITERMLTLHLQEMEKDGLITRTIYPQVPPRVEYSLTDSAIQLMPFWSQLQKWGNEHRQSLGLTQPICKLEHV
jgi:DNA-binding HxlR family transcriptional regulator